MHRWRKFAAACVLLIAGCIAASNAGAAARFARSTGNWSTITWSATSCAAGTGAALPTSADDVTICDGVTVTVNISPTVLSISIPSGGTLTTLQITSAQTLTVTGNVTATAGTGSGDNKQILLSSNAVFNVNGDVTLSGNGNDNRFALLQLSGATVTIGGNLVIDGLAGNNRARVTLANTSTLTVNGSITLSTGGLLNNGSATSCVINLRGDFNHVAADNDYVSTGGIFQVVGAGAQAFGGGAGITTTFYQLVINKTSGDLTLGHNTLVSGGAASSLLVLTQGRIVTGANSFAVGAAGATSTTISGANAASYIVGNLRRYIPTGTQSGIVFPVGGSTAGKYAPVQIDFPNVTAAGYFQVAASTVDTDHPNIGTSALDSANSVNRYWSLTNTGGITFSGATTANVTFNYPTSDIDSGADTSAFLVGDFSGGAWTYPTTGTLTSNSTQMTGLTAAAIGGDFAIAQLTGPYSYWRMNETSWNGTASEVGDFGSSGNPGTAASLSATKPTTSNTSPAISGSPGTCRYGVFNRTNKDYIALPAAYPNLATSSFTTTAWIRTTDRTQSGQRILIDDEGTTGGWGFSLGDGASGALRFYTRGSATNTLDTAALINNNTWYFVAVTLNISGTTTVATIYVYNTSGTLAGSATTTWTAFTWGNDPGPPSIGGETNASSEGTNSFGFAGNIDEVRVYRAALTQAMVNDVRQLTNPCVTTDHYAIVGSTTGVTCDASTVQIVAHDIAHTAVAPQSGTILTLSTSTGTGVWQAGLLSGAGAWAPSGANNGIATYVWPGSESSFSVTLRQNTAATVGINAMDSNGKAESIIEDLSIAFADSAFRVTTDGTSTATIGTQIAGKNSNTGFGAQTLYLQAIRTDTATGSCVGAIQSQTTTIQMAGNRINPTGGTSQVSVLNSSNALVALGTGAGVPGTYTNVTLAFDAQSKAPLVAYYPDAGSISLHAQYQLPAPPAATFLTGSSNVFVVRPFGFAFRGTNAATAIQHSTSDTGTVLAPAGDNFTMTIGAYQWAAGEDSSPIDGIPDAGVNLSSNGLTPNFAANVTITVSANLPGIATGSISRGATCASAAVIAAGSFSGGSATVADWCYSEVGNVLLTATSNDYITTGTNITGNSGLDGTGAAGGYVGRFRPKNFALSGTPTLTNRSAASCLPVSSFTYMGEGLGLGFSLVARNTQGATTLNYNGAYAKLGLGTFANFNFGAKSGATNLTTRIDSSSSSAGSWASGLANNVTAATGILRDTNPDGPYAAVQFGIAPIDSDGVAMNILDFDADGNSVNERTNLGVTTEVRYGRLKLGNAFGSELLDLPIPMETQYLNSSGVYVTNVADSCTAIALNNVYLSSGTASGGGTFTAGKGNLKIIKPLSKVTIDLCVDLGVDLPPPSCAAASPANKSWLQWSWTGSTFNRDPAARAAFGLYKSADEFIYLRENF
ncbi:MAG: LamG domain-containing protein [Betaproteobacteria bacterium]